jgi:GNAT superfamily N-acetyltransferase
MRNPGIRESARDTRQMHLIQAAYLRHLARVAETREDRGLLAVRTGVASNTENGVVSTGAAAPAETISRLIEWLAEVPASWIALDPTIGPALVAAGCTPESESWSMQRRIGALDSPLHDVRQVKSSADLDEWLSILGECGWWDDAVSVRRLYSRLGYDGLYLAENGAASAFFSGPVVLLNGVAVRPDARRSGIGRSLTLARLHEACRRGCTSATLAPTPEGRQLYESFGFSIEREPPGHWFYLPNQG